ncbi:hypothetical protein TMEC54S_03211 [Thauera mechernichensis]
MVTRPQAETMEDIQMTVTETRERLYFAYGSNLNEADWARFCDRIGVATDVIEAVGPAVLPDMQLCFDYYSHGRQGGALDIAPMRGHVVHGVLYRVSPRGWTALDRKEGAPNFYERIERLAVKPDGSMVKVFTYAVTAARRRDFCAPTAEYRALVAAGLQASGLPIDGLNAAAENRPPRAEIDHVFVYGTLLSGERNAGLIPAQCVKARQPATVAGALFDTGNGYPALALQDGARGVVQGECLQIEDLPALLGTLDRLEGFAGYDDPAPLFYRTIVEAKTKGRGAVKAWCYVGARAGMFRDEIVGGCWRSHLVELAVGKRATP